MNGIIRKLKISYPFKVGEGQKVDLYCVDDQAEKVRGTKIHSIEEVYENHRCMYKIYLHSGDKAYLWKEITVPSEGVVKEVEYLLPQ